MNDPQSCLGEILILNAIALTNDKIRILFVKSFRPVQAAATAIRKGGTKHVQGIDRSVQYVRAHQQDG
jgi:hypothetical protein